MSTVEAIRMQLPVGQGGLHSTIIRTRGQQFWYVYDCGSSNGSALRRELADLEEEHEESPLDLLVLSHLDEDHVNGVEQLLASRTVRRVALPYLDITLRLVLVARAVAERALSKSLLSMTLRPTRWFSRRGVQQVIFVMPSDGSPARDRVTAADTRPRSDTDPPGIDLDGPTTPRPGEIDADLSALVDGTASTVLPAGRPMNLGEKRSMAFWELLPFWYVAGNATAFAAAVRATFKVKALSRRTIRNIVADRDQRNALADLYESTFGDRNRTSMCLYAGPSEPSPSSWQFTAPAHPWVVRNQVAWMGTGDAPLRLAKYRRAFLNFYGDRIGDVGTFVLPHHGSRHSFPLHGLGGLSPWCWLAAAGKSAYKHPHRDLVRALSAVAEVHRVSTRRSSIYVERLWQGSTP